MNINEEQLAFYFELGLTITQWAHVERSILEVVFSTGKSMNYNAMGHGFFSVENFRSKLAFANDYIEKSGIDATHLSSWRCLHDRCAEASKLRNAIAHNTVIVYTEAKPGRRLVLVPRISRTNGDQEQRPGYPPSYAVGVRGIMFYRYQFSAIRIGLDNLAHRIAGKPEIFPKSSELVARPPTIQKIASQIYAMLGHPQKSSREKQREIDVANAAASLQNSVGNANDE